MENQRAYIAHMRKARRNARTSSRAGKLAQAFLNDRTHSALLALFAFYFLAQILRAVVR